MYYIIIRQQTENDTPQVSEIIRKAYASNIKDMFIGTLLHEATLQITIIFIAVLFIFFQVHLINCILMVPLVMVAIYMFIYATVTMKSAQIMYEKKPLTAWVAESYEPYFHNKDPRSCWYKIINEAELLEMNEKPTGRKKIIGTVAVMKHNLQPKWGWIYRLGVDKNYRRKGVASHLLKFVEDWCKDNQIERVELAMSEYNRGTRQLFDEAGFQIKQLYHKKQLGGLYLLQMYHLTSDITQAFGAIS
ncbi:uncharacterized protein LOC126740712 [Anthonomus grandis grandis]|uniref:uncharacterized protein LOC126740712 n=1 Tax=Anthonomus grandis grandis TaxID=2921223 RepID=UPI0021666F05|nr:uncharacterized protein LOC126740712 [Anthonomus grandis grandis]